MRLKFFVVPALDPERAESEINAFLASHSVASIDRELESTSEGLFWLIAVTYMPPGSSAPSSSRRSSVKVDYKKVLSEGDFEVFAHLRRLRKDLAESEGVPLYALFTNKQLALMAQDRPASLEDLRGIEGVGEARCEKYGAAFLEAVSRFSKDESLSEAEDDAPHGDSSH